MQVLQRHADASIERHLKTMTHDFIIAYLISFEPQQHALPKARACKEPHPATFRGLLCVSQVGLGEVTAPPQAFQPDAAVSRLLGTDRCLASKSRL